MRYVYILLLLIVSCQEDSTLQSVCTDPIGSQDVTMQQNTQFCFKPELNGCFRSQLTGTPPYFQAVNFTGKLLGMIVDIGPVKCLGQVTYKPVEGYVYAVQIVEKHGYVVRLPDNTYGRLFVDSWTKSPTGTVSKIYVTWQYAF